MTPPVARIHASCVAIGGRAVLLLGASGAGKSDLALRLIDRGALLVADDQVELHAAGARLLAAPPARIAGKIEVRGLGILAMAHATDMPIALVIDLDAPVERLPLAATRTVAGVALPVVALAPFEASAPIKVEHALAEFGR
jgi:serine kinase of HPr protein (carbohydrate metabolism regulator)